MKRRRDQLARVFFLLLSGFTVSPLMGSTVGAGCEFVLLGRRQILVPLDEDLRKPIRVALIKVETENQLKDIQPQLESFNEAGYFTALLFNRPAFLLGRTLAEADSLVLSHLKGLSTMGVVVHYYDFFDPHSKRTDEAATQLLSANLRAEYGANVKIKYVKNKKAVPVEAAIPKKKGKPFSVITTEDFVKKIDKAMGEGVDRDFYKLVDQVRRDLNVDFEMDSVDWAAGHGDSGRLTGLHILANGFQYFGVVADNQVPVFFLIYWNGNRLKAYVPTSGNPWNTDTMTAYGEDQRSDAKNVAFRYPELVKDLSDEQLFDFANFWGHPIRFEPEKILQELGEVFYPR